MLGNSPSVEIQASCGWRSFVHKRGEGGCCRGHCKKWSSLTVNVDPTRAESVGPNSNICEAQDRVVTPPAASAISGIPRKARDPPSVSAARRCLRIARHPTPWPVEPFLRGSETGPARQGGRE